jgi:hypothetical protein
MLSAPSLWAETEAGVDSSMSYATLEEARLVAAPVNTSFCQGQQPQSGEFMWLTVFQYHLVGVT